MATACGLIEPYIGLGLYFVIGVYLLLPVRMVRRGAPRCEPQPLESGLGVPRAGDVVGHSDALTRAMLEEIDEGFFALDWEYRYLHANRAALRLANKSLDELLGRPE